MSSVGPARQSDIRLPDDARRSLFVYNLFFPIVFAALLPSYLLRMFRRGGYGGKFAQRLGWFSHGDRAKLACGGWTWLHSISVGETMLALKLAREIRRLDPSRRIVISVTTSTGYAVAEQAACEWLDVIYNPLDLPAIVRRTLEVLRPRQIIFIEAIWPNLLATAKRQGIAVSFIPRLSPRSERRFRKATPLTGPIFRLLDLLAVAEPADVSRWTSLGVDPSRIRITGNSKFDPSHAGPSRASEFRLLLETCGIGPGVPILLGGSTFPGEERILADVMCELRVEFPDLLLILVPRHVERSTQIVSELAALSLNIVRRTQIRESPPLSMNSGAATRPSVLLVDTTGELRDWYNLATVVFVGKSLTAHGGQNPVEPVMAGKPIVFGPNMENFHPIVSQWLAADAAVQIGTTEELAPALRALFRDPLRATQLATRAREIASGHVGATERTATSLLSSLPLL